MNISCGRGIVTDKVYTDIMAVIRKCLFVESVMITGDENERGGIDPKSIQIVIRPGVKRLRSHPKRKVFFGNMMSASAIQKYLDGFSICFCKECQEASVLAILQLTYEKHETGSPVSKIHKKVSNYRRAAWKDRNRYWQGYAKKLIKYHATK